MASPEFDAVVVGAGPSGLAAAARLAHFGVKVCVLEAHDRLGGLSSWHHVAGREISSGLHAFTNYASGGRAGALGKLLRQLRLKFADLDLRAQGQSSVRFPSATLSFTNEPEFFRSQVKDAFPRDIDAFDAFRKLVRETDEGELTDRQQSARAILEDVIRNPLLAEMLLCPVMFYGNPGGVGDGSAEDGRPDMDWLLFCVVWKCIFESGFGYPAGGMRLLWEKLADRITGDGGVIRMRSRVAGLVADSGSVRAARLENGDLVTGTIFFSSAGGPETELLAGDENAGDKEVGTISIAEGIALLDSPPEDAGLTDAVVFYSFDDTLRFRRPDGLVEQSNGVVCASANYFPRAPGDNLIKVSLLANYAEWKMLDSGSYTAAKRQAADGMEAALARLGVDIRKAKPSSGVFGAFDDLFTPTTLARFTSHLDGALYGSPMKSRTGRTSKKNLFLIGADQGFHGIVGAMLSGVAMANTHWLAERG